MNQGMSHEWNVTVYYQKDGDMVHEDMSVQRFAVVNWKGYIDAYVSRMRLITTGKTYIDSFQVDLDNTESFADVYKVHDHLLSNHNVKHFIVRTSTHGYHIHVFCEPILAEKLDHRRYAEFQEKLSKDTGINIDKHMMTNPLARRRVPLTHNSKDNRIVRYVNNKGNSVKKPKIYGEVLIKRAKISLPKAIEKAPRTDAMNLKIIPPCITECTKNMKYNSSSHAERFIVMTFLYEFKSYNTAQVEQYLKTVLPEDRFYHATKEERQHLSARKYNFPSCDKIKTQGFCDPCSFAKIRMFRKSLGQAK